MMFALAQTELKTFLRIFFQPTLVPWTRSGTIVMVFLLSGLRSRRRVQRWWGSGCSPRSSWRPACYHWPARSMGGAAVTHAGKAEDTGVATGAAGAATAAAHTASSRLLRTRWRGQAAMPRLTTVFASSCSLIKTVLLRVARCSAAPTPSKRNQRAPPSQCAAEPLPRVCAKHMRARAAPSHCCARFKTMRGAMGAEMRGNAD